MTVYSYSPLNKSTQEVRLLTLFPGKFGTNIHVQLHTEQLRETSIPRYEALSYTWGTAEDPINIYFGLSDDYFLGVTQNLAWALQHLRYDGMPRTLWIDALCVDQQNLEERGHQVQRMGDIYRQATRVVVWIGQEGNDSSKAVKVLMTLSRNIDVDWSSTKMSPSSEAQLLGETHWSDRAIALRYTSNDLLLIYHLFNRSWFERLWIRQEIRLANSSAIIICGFDAIPWLDFRKAVFCLRNKRKPMDHGLGDKLLPFHERLEMVFQLTDTSSYVPFGRLVRQTNKCKCADPRDRVYALLGILDEAERNIKIIPDYFSSTTQVYQDVFLCYTYHFKNLKLLTSCEMHIPSSDMPSWVPDWSVSNAADPFWSVSASGDSAADVQFVGNGILRATGVKVATIKNAEQIVFRNTSNPEIVATIRRHSPVDLDLSGGEQFEAYCRTICCDNFGGRYNPPMLHFLDWEKSQQALRSFLGPQEMQDWAKPMNPEASKYTDYAWGMMKGRSFFATEEGYIGLGPKLAKAGDQVVVFLGCQSPMILRPTLKGKFHVVGESFIHNLMNCEALLGQLPEEYQYLMSLDGTTGRYVQAYYNRNSGGIQYTDPRWDLFDPEVQNRPSNEQDGIGGGSEKDSAHQLVTNSRLTSGFLRSVEVNARSFELV